MNFSALPPDSRTLVSKRNTKLALIWKEDFGLLGNSPVLLLLSPGKTPLTTTVAKFLDTSVCGGSWCLTTNKTNTNLARMSFICHIHNYTEYNEEWNVFSAFNPSKCTHAWSSGQPTAAPGEQSWTSCRSRDSNPQPWVTSGFKSNALSIRPTTALTPASVHSLWSSPKFLNRFCLTIVIRLRFSRLVVHLFLPHVFLPLNFLLTCLDTALCEQSASLAMNVCGLPSLWRYQWLSSGQLSDQQSSPWLCSLVNQTERPFWRLRNPLHVFWVD